jgi:protein-L-isoaspartate(D-aspartate) O-methyltransferase
MHANAATALEEYAKPGARVLDVGCGSGYLTAVCPYLYGERGLMIVGIGEDGAAEWEGCWD